MRIMSVMFLLLTFSEALNAMEFMGNPSVQQQLNGVVPDAPSDFDFEIGDWIVKHRRLKELLNGGEEWIEFEGISSTRKVLGGLGNIEDNILNFPGGAFRAIALRSYSVATKEWSIWWLDGRSPSSMDVPVVGKFEDGIGLFFADDVINGISVKIKFTWITSNPDIPRWEQAFSKDGGTTWKTNWTMEFVSVK